MSHLWIISFREPLSLNILLYLSFLNNNINLFEVEMKRRTTNLQIIRGGEGKMLLTRRSTEANLRRKTTVFGVYFGGKRLQKIK